MSLSLLVCYEVNGNKQLIANPATSCSTLSYAFHFKLGIFWTICYPIGIPVVLVSLLSYYRYHGAAVLKPSILLSFCRPVFSMLFVQGAAGSKANLQRRVYPSGSAARGEGGYLAARVQRRHDHIRKHRGGTPPWLSAVSQWRPALPCSSSSVSLTRMLPNNTYCPRTDLVTRCTWTFCA